MLMYVHISNFSENLAVFKNINKAINFHPDTFVSGFAKTCNPKCVANRIEELKYNIRRSVKIQKWFSLYQSVRDSMLYR